MGPEAADPRDRLAEWAGVSRQELDCHEESLVSLWTGLEPTDELAWRIRRAHRLHAHLGLDYEAVEIILRLVNRIEELEAASSARAALRLREEE